MMTEDACTLLTATALKRRGYRLKPGVVPVGRAYFGAPLSKHADLYVLEAQARAHLQDDPRISVRHRKGYP